MSNKEIIIDYIVNRPAKIIHVSKSHRAFVLERDNDEDQSAFELSQKDFDYCLSLKEQEIKSRQSPGDRVDNWECIPPVSDGSYNKIKDALLNARSNTVAQRPSAPKKAKKQLSAELLDLAKHCGIPSGMEKIFLSHLENSTNPNDAENQRKARLLGLM